MEWFRTRRGHLEISLGTTIIEKLGDEEAWASEWNGRTDQHTHGKSKLTNSSVSPQFASRHSRRADLNNKPSLVA